MAEWRCPDRECTNDVDESQSPDGCDGFRRSDGAGSFSSALSADRIRVATQKTGTFAWELDAVLRAHGLDRAAGLDIEITELASTEAGKIALRGGSADLILSDWLWVGRERALGDDLVFYPYSSTLGAVMVPATSV